MGLQDVFFQLRLPFDAPEARALSRADRRGDLLPRAVGLVRAGARAGRAPGVRRDARRARRAAVRRLGRDARRTPTRWDALRARIRAHGLRNSLLIAIAPTATIASIAGCYECIEPQVSNLFKRETLSGDFLQVNRYLVARAEARSACGPRRCATGSSWPRARCRSIDELPDELRAIYRTAWEIPMRVADRHGRRARRVHRPEPVAEPVHGEPEHRPAVVDVLLRLEEGAEDDLLPALAPGDAHRQGDGGSAADAGAPTRTPRPSPARSRTPRRCEACQ